MVDEDVFVDKLRYVDQYVGDLKEMRGLSKEEIITEYLNFLDHEAFYVASSDFDVWPIGSTHGFSPYYDLR